MSVAYLPRSKHIIGALDPEEIARMSIGEAIYENDFAGQYSLGKVNIAGETVYLAVELPIKRCTAQTLFLERFTQISYMLDETPDMAGYEPSFTGAIASGKQKYYWAAGVLTEDLTEGGRYALDVQLPSDELVQKGVQLGIVRSGPHPLAVAQPNGQEKIVNFFPAPFTMQRADRDPLHDVIQSAQRGLTVAIGENSPLATALAGRR